MKIKHETFFFYLKQKWFVFVLRFVCVRSWPGEITPSVHAGAVGETIRHEDGSSGYCTNHRAEDRCASVPPLDCSSVQFPAPLCASVKNSTQLKIIIFFCNSCQKSHQWLRVKLLKNWHLLAKTFTKVSRHDTMMQHTLSF